MTNLGASGIHLTPPLRETYMGATFVEKNEAGSPLR